MISPTQKRHLLFAGLQKLLPYIPDFLRAYFLRSFVQVNNKLPIELIFKKAESEFEVKQALTLIDETYLELGSINQRESRLHFSKFLGLPTTTLLIAKWKDEVIGAAALISNSAFGLPSDPIWSNNNLQTEKKRLIEISHLCIKKQASFYLRGSALLAFCKMIFKYCTEIAKVDLLVTMTQAEIKPFYTDVLLFETLKIKDSSSFFGYLSFNKAVLAKFDKAYGHKRISQNLHHYFTKSESMNIQLTKSRNFLPPNWNGKKLLRRARPRLEFNSSAIAFINGSTKAEPCKIVSVSESGIQIKLDQINHHDLVGKPVLVTFEHEKEWITCQASIKWFESQKRLGCLVSEKSYSWKKFIDLAWDEANKNSYKVAS